MKIVGVARRNGEPIPFSRQQKDRRLDVAERKERKGGKFRSPAVVGTRSRKA